MCVHSVRAFGTCIRTMISDLFGNCRAISFAIKDRDFRIGDIQRRTKEKEFLINFRDQQNLEIMNWIS